MNSSKPEVGQWYFRRDNGQRFEVVSVDEGDGTIELQDFDGNLDEIEITAWYAQEVELTSPPEDLMGIFDLTQDEADGGDPTGSEGEPMSQVTRSIDEESARLESVADAPDVAKDDSVEALLATLNSEQRTRVL